MGDEAEALKICATFISTEREKENCPRRFSDGLAAEEGDIDEVKLKVGHN